MWQAALPLPPFAAAKPESAFVTDEAQARAG